MLRRVLLVLLLAAAFAPAAQAAGGHYVFDGGSPAEQGQVRSALDASSFDWDVVPGPIVIHIAKGVSPSAQQGQIWLDAALLDTGRFSWGVVQHEYAHQIDFEVLTDAMRTQLAQLVGGTAWWGAVAEHSQLGSERFADLVSWSYWQSPDNVMKPASSSDEGGQVAPAVFRSALGSLLQLAPARTIASVKARRAPRKG
ncbi:MAG TPA: hypothetical protein VFA30_07865 [Gaiellaceae bacterium]|nr:hypothetical protein [Gaiellaceae bacterium]